MPASVGAKEWSNPLQEYLRALPRRVKAQIAPVLEQQAQRLAAAQRTALRAMQAPPEESGESLASIRVEQKGDLHFDVLAGGPSTTHDGYDKTLAFEFGTQKQPPRPFFYSTARALNTSMRAAIEGAANAAIGRNFTDSMDAHERPVFDK